MRVSRPAWQQALLSLGSAPVAGGGQLVAASTAAQLPSRSKVNEQLDRRRILASIALLASYSWYVSMQRALVQESRGAAPGVASSCRKGEAVAAASASTSRAAASSRQPSASTAQRRGRRRSLSCSRGLLIHLSSPRSMSTSSARQQREDIRHEGQSELSSEGDPTPPIAITEPVKKRRGRPPKKQPTEAESAASAAGSDPASSEQDTRPKPVTEQSAEATGPSESRSEEASVALPGEPATNTTKRRGRPPKAPQDLPQSASEQPSQAELPAPTSAEVMKARRGRPRKQPALEEQKEPESEARSEDRQRSESPVATEAHDETSLSVAEVPKKRGRPRKTPAPQEDPTLPDQTLAGDNTASASSPAPESRLPAQGDLAEATEADQMAAQPKEEKILSRFDKSAQAQNDIEAPGQLEYPTEDGRKKVETSKDDSSVQSASAMIDGLAARRSDQVGEQESSSGDAVAPERALAPTKQHIPASASLADNVDTNDMMQKVTYSYDAAVAEEIDSPGEIHDVGPKQHSALADHALKNDVSLPPSSQGHRERKRRRPQGGPQTYATKMLRDQRASEAIFRSLGATQSKDNNIAKSLRIAIELADLVRAYKVPIGPRTRQAVLAYRRKTSEMITKILGQTQKAKGKDVTWQARSQQRCLQIEARSLRGDLSGAKDDFSDMRKDYGEIFSNVPRTASRWKVEHAKGSVSPLVCVASALESIILATAFSIHSPNDMQEATNRAAQDLLMWMLNATEYFDFVTFVNAPLQRSFNNLMRSHDNIVGVLQDYVATQDCRPSDIQQGIESVLLALVAADNLMAVLKIERWCKEINISLREVVMRRLLRYYSLLDEVTHSEPIAYDLQKIAERRPLMRETNRTLIMHYAKYSNPAFEEALQQLLRHYPDEASKKPSFVDEARLVYSASAGKPEQTVSILSKEYDMSEASRSEPIDNLKRPDSRAFTYLIRAYLSADRIDDAQRLIGQQIRFGLKPDVVALNALMDAFAQRNDVPAALSLFRSMEVDKSVDIITYTGLLKLFSRTKDVLSATNIVAAMRARGIRIDRKVMGLLLNAHVEAGGWTGARHLFEYLENSRDTWLRPGPSEYNTMLKAHVQRALPVQQTYRFFNSMLRQGIQPSPVSYSLILQAACDAGIMNLAEDLFTVIEDRLGGRHGSPPGKGASAWHFTIMINAYFRVERPQIARDYLNELSSRQLPVNAALKNVIIRASANEGAADDLEVARELARSYVIESPNQILPIYEPLLLAATKEGQTEMVQSLIDDITSRGVPVPNTIWSVLLDGLRRDGNVDAVMDLWKTIFQQAVDAPTFDEPEASNVPGVKRVASSKRNVLCFPLSIVIDALTRAERYDEVAKVWMDCRKHGFAFDSHNWNHMTIALLRARRMDDGVAIIEYVLNSAPPSSEWKLRQVHTADLRAWLASTEPEKDLSAILSTGLPPFQGEVENLIGPESGERAQTPTKPPNRRYEGRVRDDLDTQLPSELKVPEMLPRVTPVPDPEATLDESYDASEQSVQDAKAKSKRGADLEAATSTKRKRSLAMRSLVARDFLDRMQSPWFAHFETMQTLNEILEDAERDNGGYLDLSTDNAGNADADSSNTIHVVDFLERYPRARALLNAFDEKVAAIRERARRDAMRM